MPITPDVEARLLDAWTAAQAAGGPLPPDVARGVDRLFAEAQPKVFVACRRIVGDEELARDLCQEALIVGYRKLGTFRREGRLATWLYGIGKGLALNAVRRRGELLSEDGVLDAADPQLSVVSTLRREEREALFREATADLSPEEQEAIWLRYVEDLPVERITELLGLDQATGARGLLQRCRRRLEQGLRTRLAARGHGSSFFQVTQ